VQLPQPASVPHQNRAQTSGEYSVIRGRAESKLSQCTHRPSQIIAANHVRRPNIPFVDQGITADGIIIEDDVWLEPGL
jgi:hypothetical protein